MVTEVVLRLEGALGALYAVCHRPADGSSRGGVLLVPPFGGEALFAERTLVTVAREVARAGWTAVRFHFSGTGESEGDGRDLSVATHLQDLAVAWAWLAHLPGLKTLAVVAFRLGALWAQLARATERVRPAGLCFWDPITDPRAFLEAALRSHVASQVATFGAVRRSREALAAALGRGETVHVLGGFPLGPRLYRELRALEPPPPPVGTAVFARPPAGSSPAPPYWDRPRRYFEPPRERLAATLAFLGRLRPAPPAPVPPARLLPFTREKPFFARSPAGHRLTGTLHWPGRPPRGGIYLVEVGVGARMGMHRLSVRLARRLAGEGWVVLRADPTGTGESEGDAGTQPLLHFYDRIEAGLCVPDLQAVLAQAVAATGVERWRLYGHCGAAASALLAFAGDPRVERFVLAETPFFPALSPPTLEAEKLRRASSWARFFTLRSDYRALLQGLWRRFRSRGPRRQAVPMDREGCNAPLLRALRRALRAGQTVELLFARGDVMGRFFAKKRNWILRGGLAPAVHWLEEANHTFFLEGAQERLFALLVARLGETPAGRPLLRV